MFVGVNQVNVGGCEQGYSKVKVAAVLITSSVGLCPYRMDRGARETGFMA